jgi:hypothetical protein
MRIGEKRVGAVSVMVEAVGSGEGGGIGDSGIRSILHAAPRTART